VKMRMLSDCPAGITRSSPVSVPARSAVSTSAAASARK
jgi:hypothetical protein